MDGYCLGGLSQDADVRGHGTSENIRGLNKGDTEASLCDKCAVVRIDDKKWGGSVEKHNEGRGPPFVIFPEITCPIRGTLDGIELVYEREDTLPDLPMLKQGSKNGCEFCKMLRESLRQYWGISHSHASHKSEWQGVTRIRTRKISYLWVPMGNPSPSIRPSQSRRAIFDLDYDLVNGPPSELSWTISFELFSGQGPLASWLRIDRDLPPTSYLSPELLSQIEGWLDSTSQCVDFSNETQSVPTRLIDVGLSDGAQQPRLILSREDLHLNLHRACSYVALSHCWGEPGDLQLKTTNCVVERFRRQLPLESCPETFRDAIKFVRAIGLRYLWIDALCIIQDNQQDWEKESLKMYEIYNRAHLTLVPLKSESPKVGFLERGRRPRMNLRFISTLKDGVNGSFWLQLAPTSPWIWQDWQSLSFEDRDTSRWVERAWILQESEFSRRLLYFGNNVVSLQTCDGHLFEENDGKPNTESASAVRIIPSIKSRLEASDDIGTTWIELRQRYSNRDLTFPRDRLPAISAFASLVQGRTKDVYLAGLWLSHLHLHLLWQTFEESKIAIAELVRHLRDPIPYIAPSWSWARMSQEVFGPLSLEYESEIQVLEALTVPEGLNTFGAVSCGHLVLRGKIYHLKHHPVIQEGCNFKLSVGGKLIAYVDIDGALADGEKLHVNNSFEWDLSTGPLSDMVMFLIASIYERQSFHGILLIPKKNGPDWLRIGTFSSESDGTLGKFFDSCETVDVKIV